MVSLEIMEFIGQRHYRLIALVQITLGFIMFMETFGSGSKIVQVKSTQ